ncbi:MAG: DUF2147 domain-containing protein [Salinivirgaceae bacterium]|nr:DUF2147 domain-containing protein [Salinivirgaceae bacterium]
MANLKTIITIVTLFATLSLFGQNEVEGIWKTIDHETGKAKSLVKITIGNDGKLYGTLLKILNNEGSKEKVCEDCPEPYNGKKITGMQIINGLHKDGKEWVGEKKIFDPGRKSFYNVKIWVENGKLKVRGYMGWLYSTQEWIRVSGEM